jgi:endonuclease-3
MQNSSKKRQECIRMNKKIKWEPEAWQTIYENIKQMRSANDAPVDLMGCDALSECLHTQKEKRLSVLISLMLSSQTKDEITSNATQKLMERIKPFDAIGIIQISDEELGQLIYPVGFWKVIFFSTT